MRIRYSTVSEKGKRPENQDVVFAEAYGEYAVFAVADGMGGHSHGEVASAEIRDAIKEWWETVLRMDQMPDIEEAGIQCTDAIQRVNKELYQKYSSTGTVVGTTLVLLLIWGKEYTAFSVGDSHIYRRDGSSLVCITVDDVWENQPEIAASLTPEQIQKDSRRGKLIAAIGVYEDVEIHHYYGKIKEKENFFLCSDGVYKYCNTGQMSKVVCGFLGGKNVEGIIKRIIKIIHKNGTKDNYSAIVCSI